MKRAPKYVKPRREPPLSVRLPADDPRRIAARLQMAEALSGLSRTALMLAAVDWFLPLLEDASPDLAGALTEWRDLTPGEVAQLGPGTLVRVTRAPDGWTAPEPPPRAADVDALAPLVRELPDVEAPDVEGAP